MTQISGSPNEPALAPRVGVAVVTYNGALWIEQCLASIRDGSCRAHVALVDNGSTDDTIERVRARHPEVALLCSRQNLGFGVGNNVAIAYLLAQGCDFVLLLNQDAYVLPESVQQLVSFMDSHPDVAVATPLHCSPDDKHIDPKTFRNYLMRHAQEFIDDALMDRQRPYYRIPGVNAAIWMVRSEVFRKVGGFDPLFFMYGEDDDLLARLADHGMCFALVPGVRVVHQRQSPPAPPARTFAEKVKRRANRKRSWLLVLIKRPAYSQLFRVKLLLAAGVVRALGDWMVDGDGVEFAAKLSATWTVLRELPRVREHAKTLAQPGAHFIAPADPSIGTWQTPRREP